MEIEITTRQRDYILLSAVYAVACIIIYLVVYFTNIFSCVCDEYYAYADAMMNGTFPYTDDIWARGRLSSWEYPPLAYLFIFIPKLFSPGVNGYHAAYLVLTFIFFVIGLWCSEQYAKYFDKNRLNVMILYTALMLLLVEFLADRYDIFPVVLTMLAVALAMRNKFPYSFAVLAVAALTGLYPAVLVPAICIYLFFKGRRKELLFGLGIFALMCTAVLGLFFALSTNASMFIIRFLNHPLQLESTFASLIELIHLFGLTEIGVSHSFGSDNLTGPLPDAIRGFILPLMIVILTFIFAHYVYWSYRKGEDDPLSNENAAVVLTISVLTFILASTVFFGQHMLWAVPLIILYYYISQSNYEKGVVLKLFILGAVFTQLSLLINYGLRGNGEMMSALGIIIVVIRNIIMVGLYLIFVRRLMLNAWRTDNKVREHRSLLCIIQGLWHTVFFGKHGEAMRYLFIGGLNVLITWVAYAAFVLCGTNPSISNAFSWIVGVVTAFYLNKVFVFESKTRNKKKVSLEAIYFSLGRLFTGIVNIVGFAALYEIGLNQELFGVDGFLAKIIISVVEIILNYYISKYVVFVQKDDEEKPLKRKI